MKNEVMTHSYNIQGMTCNGCVAKAKSELIKLEDITGAEVQLTAPQATITMRNHIPVSLLQNALNKAGNFTITQAEGNIDVPTNPEKAASWLNTYKPLLIIGAYITGITLLPEAAKGSFSWNGWMQNFMAAFFLVLSFFKLLDIKGFAETYSTYDIIAKKWRVWGYIYPFIELGLGLAYLLKFSSLITNAVTFVVMSVSIIGVLESVLNTRKIDCACLGTVFNLPMSTITIIEDALMIGMSAIIFITMI